MIYPQISLSKPDAAVRSRVIRDVNGLDVHVLEAGFETANRRCVLLLHGFPELAFSWRKVLPVLAAAGFYVVAPDQRGYGRTTRQPASRNRDQRLTTLRQARAPAPMRQYLSPD